MRRCRLYLRLWLTRCLRGSRLYPAPAASWKLLHCSFLTRPAARSALARSSPGRLRPVRSEEHTSELQSRLHLVCRLLLEKKKIFNASERVFLVARGDGDADYYGGTQC